MCAMRCSSMINRILRLVVVIFFMAALPVKAMLLIPMDDTQTDHLKAYGAVYKLLLAHQKVYWLLNYRGGSFACEIPKNLELIIRSAGVSSQYVNADNWAQI